MGIFVSGVIKLRPENLYLNTPLKILPICDWAQLANITLSFVIHLTSDFHLICYLYGENFPMKPFQSFRWNLILVLRSCKIWFSKEKIVGKISTIETITTLLATCKSSFSYKWIHSI